MSRNTQRQPRAWADLTTHERTAYLAPLIGQRVVYVEAEELRQGLAIFGPAFPIPWKHGQIVRLAPLNGKPALCLAVPDELIGLTETDVSLPFDGLHDIRLAWEPHEP